MRVLFVSLVMVAIVVMALVCWSESKGKMWDLVVDGLDSVMTSFGKRLDRASELKGDEWNTSMRQGALLTLKELRPIKAGMEEIVATSPTAKNACGLLAAIEIEKSMVLWVAVADYMDKGDTTRAKLAGQATQTSMANAADFKRGFKEQE